MWMQSMRGNMSDPEEEPVSITTVDVYDLASDIGAECEHMIEKFGPDAVAALLPKVIHSLELLESLAMRNEKENATVRELTDKITQLESDKIERAEHRQRFEKEIEAIEEQWRSESAELVSAVTRLQEENERLKRAVDTEEPPSEQGQNEAVLSRLTSIAEKQRNTLREQENMLQEKQQTIDSLTTQVERLNTVSRDLRKKHKQLQNQIRSVCEERSELNLLVQAQQKDIAILQHNEKSGHSACSHCQSKLWDEDDERPDNSMRELKAIQQERNELKRRLALASEQLRAARGEDSDSACHSLDADCARGGREEGPVQGPLPYEPDDAPWKRRHTGIGKFFRKFFADSELPTFSRRSFSSIASKMAAGTATPTFTN